MKEDQDEIERMKEYAQKEQQLHDALTKAIDKALRHDPLYLDDQMGVLAAAVMCAAFNHVSMHNVSVGDDGIDPNKYRLQLVNYMRQICYGIARAPFHYDPDAPMTSEKNEGKRKGGRLVMPDAANSWMRVFPSPLSAERLLRAVCEHDDDDLMIYDPKHIAHKMQGVLLTSMPEADKADIKRRMKAHGLTVVSGANDHRLQYVVFGAGEQASKKTQVIADRLAHQEIIEGIYFETFLQVLDELDDVAELYDADVYAQMAMSDEEEERERGEMPIREFSGQINNDTVMHTADRAEAYQWFEKALSMTDKRKDIHNVYLFGDGRVLKQWYDDLPF